MHPLPNALRLAFLEADTQALDLWWSTLSEPLRLQINTLCHQNLEKCYFGTISEDGQHIIPKLKHGQIIIRKKLYAMFDEWAPGEFEQLLSNPHLVLIWDPAQLCFHMGAARVPGPLDQGFTATSAEPPAPARPTSTPPQSSPQTPGK